MTIDPVNRANQITKSSQANSTQKNEAPTAKDSVNISKDAKELAAIKNYIKVVQAAPDIRVDKVTAAKKNLPNHQLDEKIIEKIAERILRAIF